MRTIKYSKKTWCYLRVDEIIARKEFVGAVVQSVSEGEWF
jgi:hypothetical protein